MSRETWIGLALGLLALGALYLHSLLGAPPAPATGDPPPSREEPVATPEDPEARAPSPAPSLPELVPPAPPTTRPAETTAGARDGWRPGDTTAVVAGGEREGCTLRGLVIDPWGQPAVEGHVFLLLPGGRTLTHALDGAGRFFFGPLEPGAYRLQVYVEGFLESPWEALELRAGIEEERTVQVAEGLGVHGRVFAADDGRPVGFVSITAVPLGFPPSPHIRGRHGAFARLASSAEDGSFQLAGLAPGRWKLELGGSGDFPPSERELTVTDGATPLELALERGAILTGRLLDSEGAVVDRGYVELLRGGERLARTQTAAGRYRTPAFTPGPEPIEARVGGTPGGHGWRGELPPITQSGPVEHDFTLLAPARVEGRVVDEHGAPLAHARVERVGPDVIGSPAVIAGSSGRFVFAALHPGAVRLIARKPRSHVPTETLACELLPGEVRVEEVLRTASAGALELSLTGVPAGFLSSSLGPVDAAPPPLRREPTEGGTHRLRFFDLPPGPCRLVIVAGERGLVRELELEAGGASLTLALEPLQVLEGTVQMTELTARSVELLQPATGLALSTLLAPDGSFRIGLPPGSWELHAAREGRRGPALNVTVTPGETPPAVTLRYP